MAASPNLQIVVHIVVQAYKKTPARTSTFPSGSAVSSDNVFFKDKDLSQARSRRALRAHNNQVTPALFLLTDVTQSVKKKNLSPRSTTKKNTRVPPEGAPGRCAFGAGKENRYLGQKNKNFVLLCALSVLCGSSTLGLKPRKCVRSVINLNWFNVKKGVSYGRIQPQGRRCLAW